MTICRSFDPNKLACLLILSLSPLSNVVSPLCTRKITQSFARADVFLPISLLWVLPLLFLRGRRDPHVGCIGSLEPHFVREFLVKRLGSWSSERWRVFRRFKASARGVLLKWSKKRYWLSTSRSRTCIRRGLTNLTRVSVVVEAVIARSEGFLIWCHAVNAMRVSDTLMMRLHWEACNVFHRGAVGLK